MATMLIGYDVESPHDEVTTAFLRQVDAVHTSLGVPATLFIRGQNLERNPAAFERVAASPQLELQQHTYSHMLLKTVCQRNEEGVVLVRGGSLDEIGAEVGRASTLLQEYLGIACIGLTGPYCYYRGLCDRPDILELLWDLGIRYARTFGRNEHDWFPVPLEWQPFWYEHQGFPDMLEVMTHGWHDCLLRPRVGWSDREGYLDRILPLVNQAEEQNLVYSYCAHDHSGIRDDPEMAIIRGLIEHGLNIGLNFMSCGQFYEKMISERSADRT